MLLQQYQHATNWSIFEQPLSAGRSATIKPLLCMPCRQAHFTGGSTANLSSPCSIHLYSCLGMPRGLPTHSHCLQPLLTSRLSALCNFQEDMPILSPQIPLDRASVLPNQAHFYKARYRLSANWPFVMTSSGLHARSTAQLSQQYALPSKQPGFHATEHHRSNEILRDSASAAASSRKDCNLLPSPTWTPVNGRRLKGEMMGAMEYTDAPPQFGVGGLC